MWIFFPMLLANVNLNVMMIRMWYLWEEEGERLKDVKILIKKNDNKNIWNLPCL